MMHASPDATPWQARAACQYTDPEVFFPESGNAGHVSVTQADPARGVCLGCPVRRDCLAYGLGRPERFGTWGGLSEAELRTARRRRGRTLAEVMADADARYLSRKKKQAAADARAQDAERRQQKEDAELDFFLRFAA